ncbi:putative LOB domain-containing protein [Quillaja saponaria]|uniref:LOB domain-containing protein n=1 Tax=Quillaja saponaria TaxID=32244 RepID=A0AAD7LUK7_QUISA|nr:putative LOB domain-containing protein [Quillaja saponaria]
MTGFGSSCGACKFLRRKCTIDCVFAPYFCYDQAASHFAAIHKVFGASNVSRLLLQLPITNRSDAAITISYEALARMNGPVYGCVGHIFALQQQVASLQEEIDILSNSMATSSLGPPGCGRSHETTNSYYSLQFFMQHDIDNTQYYQNPLAPQLSYEGNATINQGSNSQNGIQLPTAIGWGEDHLFNESILNPLDKLLAAIDPRDVSKLPRIQLGCQQEKPNLELKV